MQKKRRKAYRNLINALLNCHEGEEWQLLKEHSELLDSDFIEVRRSLFSSNLSDTIKLKINRQRSLYSNPKRHNQS